jgi:SAM-dependent methyltransferase
MPLSHKVRNAIRGLLQAHGTAAMKAWLWDDEFSRGRWDCLDETAGDAVYACVQKFAGGGRILDLGCGSGTTAIELEPGSYHHYTGVDISEFAVEKARLRSARHRLENVTRFTRGDIFSYEPSGSFDVILFRDSIYYVPHSRIAGMLQRYTRHLRRSGVIIVRMANGSDRYNSIVRAIEQRFHIVDKSIAENPSAVVLAFRARH